MRRTPFLLPRWSLAAALAFVLGCGGRPAPPPSPPADSRTPGQYFQDQQAATMTPNGKILTDTVTERDGRIEYATEDGKRWQVGYSRRADGTYQYGTPDEVK